MKISADALRIGMDPMEFLDQGKDEFLINLAILKRAKEDDAEDRWNEMSALSKLFANELAQILAKIYG